MLIEYGNAKRANVLGKPLFHATKERLNKTVKL